MTNDITEALLELIDVKILERIDLKERQLRKLQDRLGRARATNKRLREQIDGLFDILEAAGILEEAVEE